MNLFLKILFACILLTMLAVTSHAQSMTPIWRVSENVTKDPWFIATLFDAYCGFITFYCWVFYKESSILSRLFWFLMIMLGGNISMAAYMLLQLFKISGKDTAKNLLLNSRPGTDSPTPD